MWSQSYNPLSNVWLSTLLAAAPACVLLVAIVAWKGRIHLAALLGLGAQLLVAIAVFKMPSGLAVASTLYGAAFGIFPIGWLLLNILFVYQLSVERGHWDVLRDSLAAIAPDPRLQLILVAFAFGSFLEGMSGFGAPVAITAAILIQLGFKPLQAAVLTLIANTAPVAFGSLGIPVLTLEQVTGLSSHLVAQMIGRQLPIFSLLLPFWIVAVFAGWSGALEIWPAALTAGLAFAVPQFLVSNFHGPWLVDVISAITSMAAMVVLLRFWRPRRLWRLEANTGETDAAAVGQGAASMSPTPRHVPVHDRRAILAAWLPWMILTAIVFLWGLPQVTQALDRLWSAKLAMPHLDRLVLRAPPIALSGAKPERALFSLNLLSQTGTGILLAGILAGLGMHLPVKTIARVYVRSLWQIRLSLITIAAMLALGAVMKYCGGDAVLGMALARTAFFYPFFGTLLGWLGVALTGSDTSSNVLFGGLQKIAAQQLGVSPILMGAANSCGGVMGKMIAPQSVVIASTATNTYGSERKIYRQVVVHSLIFVVLMGIIVFLQAHVPLFRAMVPR